MNKANYVLNLRTAVLTQAFVRGMRKVIPQEYLSYFFPDEIQLLISGGLNSINMQDLQKHTLLNGWQPEDEPYLRELWRILTAFT